MVQYTATGDVIEIAKSSRSKCRQCRREIEQDELRFGFRDSTSYGWSETYTWCHLPCAARYSPARALATFEQAKRLSGRASLIEIAKRELRKSASKYPYGERASTGRARCLKCAEPIARGELRIAVEREITTVASTRVGAGYLHPACAVEYLGDPNLAATVKKNSASLAAAQTTELMKLLEKVTPKGSARKAESARPVRVTQKAQKPTTQKGDELVYADQLMEKGDPRGELIVLAAEIFDVGRHSPRGIKLAERATALTREAVLAWANDLKMRPGSVELERGLPTASLNLFEKPLPFPTHPGIFSLNLQGVNEKTMKKLFEHDGFQRIHALRLYGDSFTWDDFRAFFGSPALKTLRRLRVRVRLGIRGVFLLLTSAILTDLESLEISVDTRGPVNDRGLENVAGLPALRYLDLGDGFTDEMVAKVLASPLAQRVEQLDVQEHAWPSDPPPLPNLRALYLSGRFIDPKALRRRSDDAARTDRVV